MEKDLLVSVLPASEPGMGLQNAWHDLTPLSWPLPSLPPTGLVKAVNMAVDLIVAHFGTSRDPGVKVRQLARPPPLFISALCAREGKVSCGWYKNPQRSDQQQTHDGRQLGNRRRNYASDLYSTFLALKVLCVHYFLVTLAANLERRSGFLLSPS